MNIFKRISFWSHVYILAALIVLFIFTLPDHPGPKDYSQHTHISIYMDRNFNDAEQTAILAAALEWSTTTNYIIRYDVYKMPAHHKIDTKNSVLIVKGSPDYPTAILLDNYNENSTLGYFDDKQIIPTIMLLPERIPDDEYVAVVMHELGHSLGLEHNEGPEGFGSLMYPTIDIDIAGILVKANSNHVTLKDGIPFCKIYHCDPNKLNYNN
jgi:Matrixin